MGASHAPGQPLCLQIYKMRIAFVNILQVIGQIVLGFLAEIGRLALFAKDALVIGLTPRFYGRQILQQLFIIGYTSLPVVALTAFFTGGALALQIYTCLLYTSDAADDLLCVDLGGRRI